ncbi:MAG: hypothetical protein PHH06_02535 [Candidatus Gracilibacteria bacterium]|nr:hypothetical protein [Candidatus Gracilibacteria bacterium]
MIIYIEKKYLDNSITKKILAKYKSAKVLEIDNHKNIFDKSIAGKRDQNIIIAGANNAILEAPDGYGHKGKGYFLKNSLNCIFDCKYCYLKGAFKNNDLVIFVNYEDIKKQILELVKKREGNETIWFYSSDYSDNLAIDNLTDFTKEFIPFFDSLENVKMEIRTKSVNIGNMLKLNVSKNIEIAFSLNPLEVINKYELKTCSLDARLEAINKLLDTGWQVGVRFLPLLEIDNYQEIYLSFLKYVRVKLDFTKIFSVYIGGLLYTHEDYNKMLKKEPYLDLLYRLEKVDDGFYRESRVVRDFFYKLFGDMIKEQECNICLDK